MTKSSVAGSHARRNDMAILGIMVYVLAGAAIITSLYFIVSSLLVRGPKYRIIHDEDTDMFVTQKRNIFGIWRKLPISELGTAKFDKYSEASQALAEHKKANRKKGSNVIATADDDDSAIVRQDNKS